MKLEAAITTALQRIPPLWPLRHFVAVNPFCGLTDLPFAQACELLSRTQGAVPLQNASDYLAAFEAGQITPADLTSVAGPDWTAESLVAVLRDDMAANPEMFRINTVADLLDAERPHAHWNQFVAEEISKWCAVHFDENQTTWTSPWRQHGLYAGWRAAAVADYNPEAAGIAGFRRFVRSLPASPMDAVEHCLGILDPQNVDHADFFTRQLLTIAGWAGLVQYHVREDALRGRANESLLELLAIRLAYDAALYQARVQDGALRAAWRHQPASQANRRLIDALCRWQLAYERSYQGKLARQLAEAAPPPAPARPSVQAVFCIDVRSEVLRRNLEAELPDAQTIGFAGFFGFPVSHHTPETPHAGARCPVLLVPPVESTDCTSAAEKDHRSIRRAEAGAWKAFQHSAASCFSFVEAAGTFFAASLAKRRHRSRPTCTAAAKPTLTGADPATRINLAAGALRNMGLVTNHGRLVLLCGHGSRSANNPYASSLDCGACGGHAGDVNARIAAATLNDPAVRAGLRQQGLNLADDTWFVAGLHDTTTDEVMLPDADSVPASHRADLAVLQAALAAATIRTRLERAAALGLKPENNVAADVARRATDIAEVRPEWGLANNAALIAAPRWRSTALNLEGRVFLHDYDYRQDADSAVLTLILTAPVVVASWINLQYYASRVDPMRYGSGNKVLHNVTAGLGVVEGNAGDLKVGLPWQSIHNGHRFMHEPRRLTVYVEAPAGMITAVLEKHHKVRQLFDHGWIHLAAIEGAAVKRYTPDGWQSLT